VTPRELRTRYQHAWVREALGDAQRVLEVGCGRGELARLLGADGRDVVAIDRELGLEIVAADRELGLEVVVIDRPRAASPSAGVQFIEADFFDFADRGFDAVLFTASLHHLELPRAIDHAFELGARIVIDDFDLAAATVASARWYFAVQERLAAHGAYDGTLIEGAPDDDPLARWRAAHDHEVATGEQMIAACGARSVEIARCAYLFRYLAGGLPDDDFGGELLATVLAAEERLPDPVGLRLIVS
jgi:SAM-dependent methyltransferase